MDADYEVEAVFLCGSSEMVPPVGLVFAVLGSWGPAGGRV
jgi:hypothetical protein